MKHRNLTFLPFLGNYERHTDQPTNLPTNQQTDVRVVLGGSYTQKNRVGVNKEFACRYVTTSSVD